MSLGIGPWHPLMIHQRRRSYCRANSSEATLRLRHLRRPLISEKTLDEGEANEQPTITLAYDHFTAEEVLRKLYPRQSTPLGF